VVQNDSLLLEPTGKVPTPLMRVVFHADCVRMGCVNNVGWAAMVGPQNNAPAAWVRDAS
jgi:hypothetical protein